ncbi:unnamed protein product [Schistosoma mattheei]|uniref:Uncharacterized protein n=1 Tax=Schistosoma mattheei TaxID=31246 RepID=A0A183P874_9TREM|nr:unnamed protein product [Schistosoma mattheei]
MSIVPIVIYNDSIIKKIMNYSISYVDVDDVDGDGDDDMDGADDDDDDDNADVYFFILVVLSAPNIIFLYKTIS